MAVWWWMGSVALVHVVIRAHDDTPMLPAGTEGPEGFAKIPPPTG